MKLTDKERKKSTELISKMLNYISIEENKAVTLGDEAIFLICQIAKIQVENEELEEKIKSLI